VEGEGEKRRAENAGGKGVVTYKMVMNTANHSSCELRRTCALGSHAQL
jgi:hypothetical protein